MQLGYRIARITLGPTMVEVIPKPNAANLWPLLDMVAAKPNSETSATFTVFYDGTICPGQECTEGWCYVIQVWVYNEYTGEGKIAPASGVVVDVSDYNRKNCAIANPEILIEAFIVNPTTQQEEL